MPPSVRAVEFDAATWRELGPRMLELERAEWGARAFSPREMRWQATNRDAVVETLWDGAALIGFAVAGPSSGDRTTLLNVLVDPAYRGRGLAWRLIEAVERELVVRGISELDIDARVDNGFADNVERRYGPARPWSKRTIPARTVRSARSVSRCRLDPVDELRKRLDPVVR
jgi:GNAT superfamily N-acetyltransferase